MFKKIINFIAIINLSFMLSACGEGYMAKVFSELKDALKSKNTPPTINAVLDNITIMEDSTKELYINISDIDGDDIRLEIRTNDTAKISFATSLYVPIKKRYYANNLISFNITSANGTYGKAIAELIVKDRKTTISNFFNVYINPKPTKLPTQNKTLITINTAPTINIPFDNISIFEDSTQELYINISDANSDSLILNITSSNAILQITTNFTSPLIFAEYADTRLKFNITSANHVSDVVNVTLLLSDGDLNTTKSFLVTITKAIYWKGFVYKTVTSPYTNRTWLDRNLGASRVCTAFDDTSCYGDYYQWGRGADGHEKANSATDNTVATSITNPGNRFILGSSDADWLSSWVDGNGNIRSANWAKTDGSSICPVGFRVPTISELEDETTGALSLSTNIQDAEYNSFLKLSSAGVRYEALSASIRVAGKRGFYWSLTPSGNMDASFIMFTSTFLKTYFYGDRANARAVRCIKD